MAQPYWLVGRTWKTYGYVVKVLCDIRKTKYKISVECNTTSQPLEKELK